MVDISHGFFGAFGTAVIAGRDFAPHDFENAHVMIVNQSFARYVLGGRNAIGQEVVITVTSVLQTPAGRMIFGKVETRPN